MRIIIVDNEQHNNKLIVKKLADVNVCSQLCLPCLVDYAKGEKKSDKLSDSLSSIIQKNKREILEAHDQKQQFAFIPNNYPDLILFCDLINTVNKEFTDQTKIKESEEINFILFLDFMKNAMSLNKEKNESKFETQQTKKQSCAPTADKEKLAEEQLSELLQQTNGKITLPYNNSACAFPTETEFEYVNLQSNNYEKDLENNDKAVLNYLKESFCNHTNGNIERKLKDNMELVIINSEK